MHHPGRREAAAGPSSGWYLLQGQDLPRGLHQWEVRGEALGGSTREIGILIAWLDLLVIAKPRGPSRELEQRPCIGFIHYNLTEPPQKSTVAFRGTDPAPVGIS